MIFRLEKVVAIGKSGGIVQIDLFESVNVKISSAISISVTPTEHSGPGYSSVKYRSLKL